MTMKEQKLSILGNRNARKGESNVRRQRFNRIDHDAKIGLEG